MIKKLKKKFIVLAMTMLVILVALIVASMNVINYVSVVSEADNTLVMLSELNSERAVFTNIPEAGSSGMGDIPGMVQEPEGTDVHDSFVKEPGSENPGGNMQDGTDPGEINPEGNGGFAAEPSDGNPVKPTQDDIGDGNENFTAGDNLFIADGDTQTPETDENGVLKKPDDFQDMMDELGKRGMEDRMPGNMNVEVAYESRFFSVSVDADGDITDSDLSMTASVTEDDIGTYVKKALSKKGKSGFAGDFRYMISESDSGSSIVFLDCGRKLGTFNRFLLISSLVGFGGCVIAFLIFFFASGRIVKPISDSYEKQKTFITDASHEIKTPLTVISANLELLRSENADEECVNDISAQVKRLTALTNDLVSLSRMQEGGSGFTPVEFPASESIEETALSFRNAVTAAGKKLTLDIQPLISINGDLAQVQRVVSILLENALKYSSPETEIKLGFEKKGKTAVLTVSNKVSTPISAPDLERLFDRFYRTDKSRSSSAGGHGIGLSIARQIMELHRGRISASMPDGDTFVITASFPL